MLRELVEYYDCIIQQPDSDFVPDGFMKVPNVAYKIVLTQDGKLKDILPNTHIDTSGKKPKEVGYDEIFPFSRSVSTIKAKEVIDYREKYIFGIDWDTNHKKFVVTESSYKSFQNNKEYNLTFFEDISSSVIDAYKNFLNTWNPKNQLDNPILAELGKSYEGAKFIIVVENFESKDYGLHQDIVLKNKWLNIWQSRLQTDGLKNPVIGQCAISGKIAPIERVHYKLKGIVGGKSEVNLVCFNEDSSCSYGKEQSYNSSISTEVMEKYTKIFNYIASSKQHSRAFDDITLLFWVNTKEKETPYLEEFLCELWESDPKLESAVNELSKGRVALTELDKNIEFCVVGVKPNSSRLSIKFFEKNSFGQIMERLAQHQTDVSLSKNDYQLSIAQIINELKPTRVRKEKKKEKNPLPPDLFVNLFMAILQNRPYPEYLLQTLVHRAKIDKDILDEKNSEKFDAISSTRARIIKACLIRSNYYKGDEYMIDSAKQTVAFRCGRLFAVLEKIQKEALGENINATIKDRFFASACSTPDLVFARLLKLSQPHLEKMKKDGKKKLASYFEYRLQEIIAEIDAFPKALPLQKQGDFILGYYQEKTYRNKNEENES